jgi:hypothetical protein
MNTDRSSAVVPTRSVKRNMEDDRFVVVTRYGRYSIRPYGLDLLFVRDRYKDFCLGKSGQRWYVGRAGRPYDNNKRIRTALVQAVDQWIAANTALFHEMQRRSLEGEMINVGGGPPYIKPAIVLGTLEERVKLLKAVGGKIAGFGLSHYERVLKLATSTITELEALDAAMIQRAAA